jgi:hypothetical protein
VSLQVTVDASTVEKLAQRFISAPKKVAAAQRFALQQAGNKARTGMRRALVGQTGLKYGVLVRAIRGNLSGRDLYVIRSRGGNIRLKFFSPRETRRGTVHKSPKLASPVPNAFMKGGRFPKRVPFKGGLTNGEVHERTGKGRWPVRIVRSGVFIPAEMVEGASKKAFFDASNDLAERMARKLLQGL